MNKEEEKLQTKVCRELKKLYPGLIFFSDFAAGLFLPVWIASIRSQQSMEGKFLDLTILEPRDNYHGLSLEIKVSTDDLFLKDGKTLKSEHVQEQYNTIKRLRAKGYCSDFACGYDDIMWAIRMYIINGNFNYKTIIERKVKIDVQETIANDFFGGRGL